MKNKKFDKIKTLKRISKEIFSLKPVKIEKNKKKKLLLKAIKQAEEEENGKKNFKF